MCRSTQTVVAPHSNAVAPRVLALGTKNFMTADFKIRQNLNLEFTAVPQIYSTCFKIVQYMYLNLIINLGSYY